VLNLGVVLYRELHLRHHKWENPRRQIFLEIPSLDPYQIPPVTNYESSPGLAGQILLPVVTPQKHFPAEPPLMNPTLNAL
jgi:hypothetical protein